MRHLRALPPSGAAPRRGPVNPASPRFAAQYGHYRYRFPEEQDELHRSFTSERAHLDLLFPAVGRASTLAAGDGLEADAAARCWHVYVADLRGSPQLCGPANALLFRGFAPVAGVYDLRAKPEQVDARSRENSPAPSDSDAAADEVDEGGGAQKMAGYETPEQLYPYDDRMLYADESRAVGAAAELVAATDGVAGVERENAETVLEVAMELLSPQFTAHFFFDGVAKRADDPFAVARASGIEALMPGVLLDPWCFEPCGFSLNGLRDGYYFTIHITPEPQMSFASFETNDPRYASDEFVATLLATFKPQHATVLVTARAAPGVPAASVAECGEGVHGYRLLRATQNAFGGGKHAQAIGARCAVLEQLVPSA